MFNYEDTFINKNKSFLETNSFSFVKKKITKSNGELKTCEVFNFGQKYFNWHAISKIELNYSLI